MRRRKKKRKRVNRRSLTAQHFENSDIYIRVNEREREQDEKRIEIVKNKNNKINTLLDILTRKETNVYGFKSNLPLMYISSVTLHPNSHSIPSFNLNCYFSINHNKELAPLRRLKKAIHQLNGLFYDSRWVERKKEINKMTCRFPRLP